MQAGIPQFQNSSWYSKTDVNRYYGFDMKYK